LPVIRRTAPFDPHGHYCSSSFEECVMSVPGMDPYASEGAPEQGASSMREQIRGIKDQAIEQGRTSLRDARDRAASSLGDSKGRVADQFGAVAHAFRQAGDQLRNEGQSDRIAGLTDAMARQADQAAEYLRRADGEILRRDVERLARRQPALVLGGAFVAGLIGARFLKSSERRRLKGRGDFEPESPYRPASASAPLDYDASYATETGYGSGYASEYGSGPGYGSGTSSYRGEGTGYRPAAPDYTPGVGETGGPDASR
jgi:hypothetical protein